MAVTIEAGAVGSLSNAGSTVSGAGATGGARILSREELERMSKLVDNLDSYVEHTVNDLKVVINSFNNETIVNSFYASGNYGADIQVKMEGLLDALQKYVAVISSGNDSLVDQTRKYVQRQLELIDSGR